MPSMSGASNQTLERQAIHWLVRLQSQPDDDRLQQACLQWRQDSQAHEQAWQAVQVTYRQLRQHVQQVPTSLPASPTQLLQHSASRMSRRRAMGQLGGLVALALPLGWVAREYTPWQRLGADHATQIGQRTRLTLADGSHLMLNTDSAVRLQVNDGDGRILLDRGEIYLQRSVDGRSNPMAWRIDTGAGQIQVDPASRLSVRRLADGARLHLASGGMQWQGKAMFAAMRATAPSGQAADASSFQHHGTDWLLTAAQANPAPGLGLDMLAWTDGYLVAQDARLADVLAELDRYRPGRLDWTPDVASLRISGTYQLHDTDQVLALLSRALPIAVGRRTRYWTTVRASA